MKGSTVAYRNITVNGTTYKFVIGKKFTKVVGVASVPNSELGAMISRYGTRQKAYSETGELIPWEDYIKDAWYRVTPADVRRLILGDGTVDPHFHDGPDNEPHTCGCGKTGHDVALRVWPFDAEIYGKCHYDYICDECAERNADDI